MSATERKNLRDRAKEFAIQLPFMEGRDKGDIKELVGTINTIVDYGFLVGEDEKTHVQKDYVCFIVKERGDKFYFGGQVLTDQLQQLHAEGYYEDIVAEGLPILMKEKQSKNKRKYINVEFYPE